MANRRYDPLTQSHREQGLKTTRNDRAAFREQTRRRCDVCGYYRITMVRRTPAVVAPGQKAVNVINVPCRCQEVDRG